MFSSVRLSLLDWGFAYVICHIRGGQQVRLHKAGLAGQGAIMVIQTLARHILQEAVQNVLHHAEAQKLAVQLLGTLTYLTLMVEEYGRGFGPKQVGGLGMHNIQLAASRWYSPSGSSSARYPLLCIRSRSGREGPLARLAIWYPHRHYYWLNERERLVLLGHLQAEDAYFDQEMAPVKVLEQQLAALKKGGGWF